MMLVVQHHRQPVQGLVAKTFGLDRLHRRQHIITVDAGLAVALQHMSQLIGEREPPGLLHVAAIDHVDERADPLQARSEGFERLALGYEALGFSTRRRPRQVLFVACALGQKPTCRRTPASVR